MGQGADGGRPLCAEGSLRRNDLQGVAGPCRRDHAAAERGRVCRQVRRQGRSRGAGSGGWTGPAASFNFGDKGPPARLRDRAAWGRTTRWPARCSRLAPFWQRTCSPRPPAASRPPSSTIRRSPLSTSCPARMPTPPLRRSTFGAPTCRARPRERRARSPFRTTAPSLPRPTTTCLRRRTCPTTTPASRTTSTRLWTNTSTRDGSLTAH
ncbi:hypothetical protein DFJ74DRAFT_297589 [Hyaloraphidium curvatum]|nr:hypothetical protein DFJ74DRAFT_297589 [Hyaloraphidium curvatum]